MTLTGTDVLDAFGATHADARGALNRWQTIIRGNSFRNILDMRKTLGAVDPVGDYTVFNIRGNKYRLIALIDYEIQVCVVTEVLTHKEYDKWSPGL